MEKFDVFCLFVVGIVIGMFVFGALFNIFDPIRVESVEDLTPPEKMFRIIIDGVSFTCTSGGSIVENKAILYGCEEVRGHKLVIKNFESYSVEMISP